MTGVSRARPIRARFAAPALALTLVLAGGCDSGEPEQPLASTPDAVRLVTDDLDRFWEAYDAAVAAPTRSAQIEAFQMHYLDPGSPGLRDFVERRIGSAARLRDAVFARRAYFDAIRPEVVAVADGAVAADVRASFETLDRLYADAVFADTYFLVGRMSTGGTVGPSGLLIGTELFTASDGVPLDELTPWQRSVVRPSTLLPAIVAHELVHIQQAGGGETLLAQALREGAADFVGEMLAGAMFNGHLHAWADSLEAELWGDFAAEMHGRDVSRWLYNGSTPPPGRPADLGYYVGYKICEHYYEHAADRPRALAEIIALRDPVTLLEASGYAEQFAPRTQPPREAITDGQR